MHYNVIALFTYSGVVAGDRARRDVDPDVEVVPCTAVVLRVLSILPMASRTG